MPVSPPPPISAIGTSLSRGVLLFDTSSLPNDAVITAAEIQLYITYKVNNHNQSINVVSSTPASNTALAATDYPVASFGSTDFVAVDTNINDLTINTYNVFALNAAGIANIDVSGVSKFAVRLSDDIDDTPISGYTSGDSYISFSTAESSNKPKLVVTYTSAGGGYVWISDAGVDLNFIIFGQSNIDGYLEGKEFELGGVGKNYKLHRFLSKFATTANYSVELSLISEQVRKDYQVDLSSDSAVTWGGGYLWGAGYIWGGAPTSKYSWKSVSGLQGKTLKVRVRNRLANQPFEFNGVKLIVTGKLRQK